MTRIFISHSHADEAIAYKLVDFLIEALGLNSREILCTSDPDLGLSYSSSSITDQLKEALKNSEALIILITSDSLHSAWIPFEAGSFWTTDKPIIPILGPDLTQNDLPGPLKNILSIQVEVQDVEGKVNSAANQLAEKLNLQQVHTNRRNIKLQEFLDSLRAWQSQRPALDQSQQQEIEELKAQIQNLNQSYNQQRKESEQLHQQQLKEIEATHQKEKEELEQNYQNQIQQLEESIQSKILITSLQNRDNNKPPLLIYDPDLDIKLVKRDDLFFPELKFIELEDALPGALSPKFNQPLVFNSQHITPLIPLKPLLLDYFTPEDLLSRIEFQILKTREGLKIRLILDLPLKDNEVENYCLWKDYELKEENSLGDQLPVLQIWPNFQKKGWQEYYIFYYDGELEDRTFKITYPQAKNIRNFKKGFGTFLMYRTEEFPEYLPCIDFNDQEIGLILFESPLEIKANKNWQVGINFDSSLTNVYIKANNQELPQPLELKNLQLQVTCTDLETRLTTLFEYFIPENFKLVADSPALPLSSVLTTRGKDPDSSSMLPILDGRIYIPDNDRFEAQEEWVKTNLTWSQENEEIKLFLKHLALHIAALAANEGVSGIQWSVSYPLSWSQDYIRNYRKLWKDITKELEKTTGITHDNPEINSDSFRTESLAIAQYFADIEEKELVYNTCIDMGGVTSEISIWKDNRLIHQCSVQLAGRDIFSHFIQLNPTFAEEKFGLDPKEWKELGSDAFNAKLDVWLRYQSNQWLTDNLALLRQDEEFQGLTQLMTIGIAGIYYYVGILLKVLKIEAKHKQDKITPVYLGGDASRFMYWLDPTGQGIDQEGQLESYSEIHYLLSWMLNRGSSFNHADNAITKLSNNRRDEVACGLVTKKNKLKVLDEIKVLETMFEDPIISGEAYTINGIEFGKHSRINFLIDSEQDQEIENIIEFTIPKLEEVPNFIYEYHKAIRDLDLKSITPLKGYTRSRKYDENPVLWQNTQRELEQTLLTIKGDPKEISIDSTFILGLKALLRVLAKQWAEK